jgi:limonene-1,2-epoxide hydrolase
MRRNDGNGRVAMTADASRALIEDFLGAWAGRDIDALVGFFADDAVYHNVPVAPIQGIEGIRQIFAAFLATFDAVSLDIVNLVAAPELVFAERIDRFAIGERHFDLPVNGVFEIRNGRIARFSDYFDLATFERSSGIRL